MSENPYENLLFPIFETEKDKEEFISSIETEDNFKSFEDWVKFTSGYHQRFIEVGKWFIFKNWEKVKDWVGYSVEIKDQTYSLNETEEYPTQKMKEFWDKVHESEIPIKWIKFTYDYTDSDLSVTINDKDNWTFLDDNEVINLVLFIEQKLKK